MFRGWNQGNKHVSAGRACTHLHSCKGKKKGFDKFYEAQSYEPTDQTTFHLFTVILLRGRFVQGANEASLN